MSGPALPTFSPRFNIMPHRRLVRVRSFQPHAQVPTTSPRNGVTLPEASPVQQPFVSLAPLQRPLQTVTAVPPSRPQPAQVVVRTVEAPALGPPAQASRRVDGVPPQHSALSPLAPVHEDEPCGIMSIYDLVGQGPNAGEETSRAKRRPRAAADNDDEVPGGRASGRASRQPRAKKESTARKKPRTERSSVTPSPRSSEYRWSTSKGRRMLHHNGKTYTGAAAHKQWQKLKKANTRDASTNSTTRDERGFRGRRATTLTAATTTTTGSTLTTTTGSSRSSTSTSSSSRGDGTDTDDSFFVDTSDESVITVDSDTNDEGPVAAVQGRDVARPRPHRDVRPLPTPVPVKLVLDDDEPLIHWAMRHQAVQPSPARVAPPTQCARLFAASELGAPRPEVSRAQPLQYLDDEVAVDLEVESDIIGGFVGHF